MLCLEIHVNGRRLCRAGVGASGVLSAIVNWVGGAPRSPRKRRRSARGETELNVGGLYHPRPGDDAFPEWVSRKLAPGDEVLIRVLRAADVDVPKRQKVHTRDWIEKHEREYYNRMKQKFERPGVKGSGSGDGGTKGRKNRSGLQPDERHRPRRSGLPRR